MENKKPFDTFEQAKPFAISSVQSTETADATKFLKVLEFCFKYPDAASGIHSSKPKLSRAWIKKKAEEFVTQRDTTRPQLTNNVTDPLVTEIATGLFGIEPSQISQLLNDHKVAMAAENKIGSLLEEYIASIMEPKGWIWCSGNIIKAVDFIKFPANSSNKPVLLQIKNRSNSENSSSANIRKETTIEKWYRLDAGTGQTRWNKFPDSQGVTLLTEKGFEKYVKSRIDQWNA